MTHPPDLDVTLAAYDLAPPVEPFTLLDAGGINNGVVGVRTGSGDFVWKVYRTHGDPATIAYEHRLLGWLTGVGLSFAIPVPIATRGGETVCHGLQGWVALFPLLPGAGPDRRDPAQVEALGAALCELHAALARYPSAPRPGLSAYGDLERVHPRIPTPFGLTPDGLGLPDTPPYAGLLSWWRDELAQLRRLIEEPYRMLPQQVIHGDFGPGNTLFLGGRLVAVLDFDFAGPDARALDLASGLNFSMRIRENPEPLAIARAFCRGYARGGRLTDEEVAAIPWLLRLRDATSAVWWLGRALATGDARPELGRIEEMQASVRWLEEHGRRLVEVVGRELQP